MVSRHKNVEEQLAAIVAAASEYLDYIASVGNECAYTDRMIESVVAKAVDLAHIAGCEYMLKPKYPVLGGLPTLDQQDKLLEQLWDELADVPVDPETERLEKSFYFFPRGIQKEDIWHWFDERYSKGVYHLLYGTGGDDRKDRQTELLHLDALCEECGATDCAYLDNGICRLALVKGKAPLLSEDGCADYAMA